MSKARHLAVCIETFTHVAQLGALVNALTGEQIAPPETREFHYEAGKVWTFSTKRDRDAFIKAHPGKFREG